MAYRQYIGARYVPLYAGRWDATRNYEPLTIVDDANGNSYTSKKDVPVGTALNNTDYWVQTSSFSGAVTQLQDRMTDAERDIDALETRAEQTEADVGTLQNDVAGITSEVSILRNRRIILAFDSYGTRTDTDGKTISEILIENGFPVVFEKSFGGAGFTKQGDYDISTYPSEYTGDKTKITDIIFGCSANDTTDFVTVRIAIESKVAAVKAEFPNATIHLLPWGVIFQNTEAARNLIRDTLPAYNFASASVGAKIATNIECVLRNTNMLQGDFVHPAPLGVAYLARAVATHLSGNVVDVEYTAYVTITNTDPEITGFSAPPIIMRRKNHVVEIAVDQSGGNMNMFTIEHVDKIGNFTPAAQGLILSASLVSFPYSYMNGKYYSVHGYETATTGSGSPVPVFGATMRMVPYRDQFIFTIVPNMQGTECKRFFGTDSVIVIND